MYHDGLAREATIRRLTMLAERALNEGVFPLPCCGPNHFILNRDAVQGINVYSSVVTGWDSPL